MSSSRSIKRRSCACEIVYGCYANRHCAIDGYLGLRSQFSVFIDKFDVLATSFRKLVLEILSFGFVPSSILLLLGNVFVKVSQTRLQLIVRACPR